MSKLLTAAQVREILAISDDTLRRLIKDKKLVTVVLGPRSTRVTQESVEQLIREGKTS